MKKLFPFVIGGILAAFGDELQNWVVVFLGGMICGVSLMWFIGMIVAMLATKSGALKIGELFPKDKP